MARLDRPRAVALGIGLVLAVGGGLLAAFAPEAPVLVPSLGPSAPDAPALAYVRSLPDAGDPDLVRPTGLVVEGRDLFVADAGAGVVRVFSTAGPSLYAIGEGVLGVPAYVARDLAADTVLVTDRELGAVLRFGTDGEPLGEIRPSTEPSAAWEPLGVAADGEGTVVVTDTLGSHRVLVMDRGGQVLRTVGGPVGPDAAGGVSVALDFPNSVAFFGDELWVGDSNNRRVLVFDAEGALLRLVRVDGIARGLALVEGTTGRYVAVVDALTSEIVLLDAEGVEVARYGGPGSTAGRLAYPNDVAYDARTGQLYVADTGNARVQVWSVTWPGEEGPLDAILTGPVLSAMRLAGFILAGLGIVLVGVAVWPRRATARALLDTGCEDAADDDGGPGRGPGTDGRGLDEAPEDEGPRLDWG